MHRRSMNIDRVDILLLLPLWDRAARIYSHHARRFVSTACPSSLCLCGRGQNLCEYSDRQHIGKHADG